MLCRSRIDVRKIKTKMESDYFLLFVIAAAYVITASSLALAGHYAFYTNAWDLGIYTQAFHSTVNNGKMFYYTAELPGNPSGSLFGIHFSPFLFLLAPIYAIFQSPITLLILRPIAIAAGLIPLYWILRDQQLNSKGFVALFAIVYLFYPPVSAGYLNFDVEAFLPALFLFAIHYLRKGKLSYSYIFVVLALMVNEFVPLIIIAMAFYSFLLNRKEIVNGLRQKKLTKNAIFSIILFLTGILWFKLASMVIAYFNPSALNTKWEWGELGTSPEAIITSIFTNPVKILQILSNNGPMKFLYITALLGPVAFLPLLDPLTCVMALPWLAASMLSVNPSYYSVGPQYPAFISAFIFVAAINGLKKIVNIESKKNVRKVFFLVPIMLLITTLLIIPVPAPVEAKKPDDAARFALEKIPANASASVMPEYFPHVCNRLDVYPYFKSGVDYVMIDVYSWWYDVTLPRPADAAPRWCDMEIGDEYGLVVNSKGILLYEKGYSGSVFFEGVNFTYDCRNVTVEKGEIARDNLTIAGLRREADVLIHRVTDGNSLFFSVPTGAFPPGRYNFTVNLKVTSTVSEDVAVLEITNRFGAEVLNGRIRGADFAGSGEWQAFSFFFTISEPTFLDMKVNAGNSTDVYFYSLDVLQASGSP